jgi:hypothetical protein
MRYIFLLLQVPRCRRAVENPPLGPVEVYGSLLVKKTCSQESFRGVAEHNHRGLAQIVE